MNFLELVKARYSARKYANRPVEAEKLDYIMECVRFAPSAVNHLQLIFNHGVSVLLQMRPY